MNTVIHMLIVVCLFVCFVASLIHLIMFFKSNNANHFLGFCLYGTVVCLGTDVWNVPVSAVGQILLVVCRNVNSSMLN